MRENFGLEIEGNESHGHFPSTKLSSALRDRGGFPSNFSEMDEFLVPEARALSDVIEQLKDKKN